MAFASKNISGIPSGLRRRTGSAGGPSSAPDSARTPPRGSPLMGGRWVGQGWGEGAGGERVDRYESSARTPLALAAHRENDSLPLLVRRDGGRRRRWRWRGFGSGQLLDDIRDGRGMIGWCRWGRGSAVVPGMGRSKPSHRPGTCPV